MTLTVPQPSLLSKLYDARLMGAWDLNQRRATKCAFLLRPRANRQQGKQAHLSCASSFLSDKCYMSLGARDEYFICVHFLKWEKGDKSEKETQNGNTGRGWFCVFTSSSKLCEVSRKPLFWETEQKSSNARKSLFSSPTPLELSSSRGGPESSPSNGLNHLIVSTVSRGKG